MFDATTAYCFLAEIKEQRSNIRSLIEVFQELVETSIALEFPMNEKRGKILDLQEAFKKTYNMDIPVPTLKLIERRIKREHSSGVSIYSDGSFQIAEGVLLDRSDIINLNKQAIDDLQKLYSAYSAANKLDLPLESLFSFIETFIKQLLAVMNNSRENIPAGLPKPLHDFISVILKFPQYRTTFEKIVMGYIISSYLRIPNPEKNCRKKIFLLDTNFLVSLMDLHTEEAYNTTESIVTIAHKKKHILQVLPETIKETRNLIERKARDVGRGCLFASQKPRSIEGGCIRRKLTESDLLLFAKRLEYFVQSKRIQIVTQKENDKLIRIVQQENKYKPTFERQFNQDGALHDAMAICYVENFRKTNSHLFNDAESFFVTDPDSSFDIAAYNTPKFSPVIRADDLLNILWLSNPIMNAAILNSNISRMLATYLDKKLPDVYMLARIDEKIASYAAFDLDEQSCVDLALNIAETDNQQLEELLALPDPVSFNKKVIDIADKVKGKKAKEDSAQEKNIHFVLDFARKQAEKGKIEIKINYETKLANGESNFKSLFNQQEIAYKKDLIKTKTDLLRRFEKDLDEMNALIQKKMQNRAVLFCFLVASGIAWMLSPWAPKNLQIFAVNTPLLGHIAGYLPAFLCILYLFLIGKPFKIEDFYMNLKKHVCKKLFEKVGDIESEIAAINIQIKELKRQIKDIESTVLYE